MMIGTKDVTGSDEMRDVQQWAMTSPFQPASSPLDKNAIKNNAYPLSLLASAGVSETMRWTHDSLIENPSSPFALCEEDSLKSLLNRVENHHELSPRHMERTALFSLELARQSDLTDAPFLHDLYLSAILHDIGNTRLREGVLSKPGPLSLVERFHVETHAHMGADMVAKIPGMANVGAAIRAHHERWDGSGYPCGLSMWEIPLAARILALCDVFDALISERPHHLPVSIPEAVRIIEMGADTHFDPDLVSAFMKISWERWGQLCFEAWTMSSVRAGLEAAPALVSA